MSPRQRLPDRSPSRCPRCGAPTDDLQQVCLHCGLDLGRAGGVLPALAAAWRRVLPWYPGDWIWPALALAAVAISSSAATVAVHEARHSSKPSRSTTTTALPTTWTATRTSGPTITTGTLPVAPGPPSTAVPTAPPPAAGAPAGSIVSWPRKRPGYTVILQSIPQADGRGAAVAEAGRAIASGLAEVGILLSSSYSSLRAGYWVVFTGIDATAAQAEAAIAGAHAHGFGGAYPARVAP